MLRRLFDTVRPLRPDQLVWRVRRRLFAQSPAAPREVPGLAALPGRWESAIAKRRVLLPDGGFRFLNETGWLDRDGWAAEARSALWRYNLHYFDCAAGPAADEDPERIVALMRDWIARCPAGTAVAWDPYPLSLRIVNWLKFGFTTGRLPDDVRASLAHQADWLAANIEFDIRANHLFANAKALTFAGLALSGPGARRWLQAGRDLAIDQAAAQFGPDGGHFELSPMYHAIVLEDVCDLANLARAAGDPGLAMAMEARIAPGLAWLAAMSHPDGGIAFFNDAAFGIAPTLADLSAYAARLGASAAKPGALDCGYVRIAAGDGVLIADLAPAGPGEQPGHAHADTLSCEFSLGTERVIVNSGTSLYGLGPERERQRGTAAHSTLVLDGCDSSEVWAGFRLGRRARATLASAGASSCAGSHDGYRFLPGSPVHHRGWRLEPGRLTIEDRVESRGDHAAELIFHLHPDLRPVGGAADLRFVTAAGRTIRVEADRRFAVEPGTWYPEFGLSVPNLRLVARWRTGRDGAGARTTFVWGAA